MSYHWCLEEETDPHLTTVSFKLTLECYKVSLEPPFLGGLGPFLSLTLFWAKQPPAPSGTPHKAYSLDPTTASLAFFGHAPASCYLSCSEGPKNEHSI